MRTARHCSCQGRSFAYSISSEATLSVAVAVSLAVTCAVRRVSPHIGHGAPADSSVTDAPQFVHVTGQPDMPQPYGYGAARSDSPGVPDAAAPG